MVDADRFCAAVHSRICDARDVVVYGPKKQPIVFAQAIQS